MKKTATTTREEQQISIELARRIETLSDKRLPPYPTDKMCCLIEAEDSLREAFEHKGHDKGKLPKGAPKSAAQSKWFANEPKWYREELRRLTGLIRAIGDELGLPEYKLHRLPRSAALMKVLMKANHKALAKVRAKKHTEALMKALKR
jgi:hypothetical protein